jgi:hypothetical protein
MKKKNYLIKNDYSTNYTGRRQKKRKFCLQFVESLGTTLIKMSSKMSPGS